MNAFPDRQCEVKGCTSGRDVYVVVVLDRMLCDEHFLEYETFENLLSRRKLLLGAWLEKKAEVKP